MHENEISTAIRYVQGFTLILLVALLVSEILWMVRQYRRRSKDYLLGYLISLLAVHGIIYYLCIFLDLYGLLPSDGVVYWLFSNGLNRITSHELFTQWSAVLRGNEVSVLLLLSVVRNVILSRREAT